MSEPVLWELGEHSPGKHLVLGRYLNAWLPILGMTQGRIVFVDGFCGPGQYRGGESGSPIIALRALKNHAAKSRIAAEVIFYFIDSDARRVNHLRELVDKEWADRPENVQVHYEVGQFDHTMTSVLDSVEVAGKRLAPTLVMADPFGISDTPMEVFRRILRNEKCELYISFMWEHINRFKGTEEFEPHLDRMFGTPRWREGIEIADTTQRAEFLFGLYKQQLKDAGARHVVRFDLYDGNRLKYAIFFATKHPKACDRMKQAIWGVAPFGDFAFRGVRGGQLGLGLDTVNLDGLGRELQSKFSTGEFIAIEKLGEYCQSDETDFHSSHLKAALRELEKAGELEVDPATRKRSGTFPDGTKVRLVQSEPPS